MSAEFNPIPGQADIISRMAESGDREKPKKGPEKKGKTPHNQPKAAVEGEVNRFSELLGKLERGELAEELTPQSRTSLSGEFSPRRGNEGFRLIPIEVIKKRAKAEGAEILFESQIPLHGNEGEVLNFPVVVERRKDGHLVMNDLPDQIGLGSGYDRKIITEAIKGSGVAEDVKLPDVWETMDKEAKKAFLQKEYGIGTLDVVGLNVGPDAGGEPGGDVAEEEAVPPRPLMSQGRFRNLLILKHRLVHEEVPLNDPRIAEYDRQINELRVSNDPLDAYYVSKDTKDFIDRIPKDKAGQLETVTERNRKLRETADLVLIPTAREEISIKWEEIDKVFQDLTKEVGNEKAIFGRLDTVVEGELGRLTYGGSLSDSTTRIEEAARRISGNEYQFDPPGFERIISWYAVKQIENLEVAYREERRSRISAKPEENIAAAYDRMQFAEKSGTREAFGDATRHLQDFLKVIESSRYVEEKDKAELREHIDAFDRLTRVFIYLRESGGDPHTMTEAIKNIKNKTFYWFYHRYNRERIRNEKGEDYLFIVNKKGEKVEGKDGRLNVLSEAENVLIEKYFRDRFRMNFVEKLTKETSLTGSNLDKGHAVLSMDKKWLEVYAYILKEKSKDPNQKDKKSGRDIYNDDQKKEINRANGVEIDALTEETLEKEFELIKDKTAEINSAWNGKDNKKFEAVQKWYQQQTLIGAGDDINKEQGRELRIRKENDFIEKGLRERLTVKGVRGEAIDELLRDRQLVDSIARGAGNLVTFKFSALDRMRVYRKDTKERTMTIKGQNTPYFMWQKDHPLDYFMTERHGDERVLRTSMNAIDREWSVADRKSPVEDGGFMLPQMMAMIRLVGQDGILEKNKGGLKDTIDNLRNKAAKDHGKAPSEYEAIAAAHVLFNGYDDKSGDADKITRDFFYIDWAEKSDFLIKDELLVDNASDSESAAKFYNGVFKKFLFRPYEKDLMEMLAEYYSSRHVRKRPGMEFFLEVYWDVGHHWKDWLGYKENITMASMEFTIQKAIEENYIDEERAKDLEGKLMGVGITKFGRQMGELINEIRKGYMTWGTAWDAFVDFWKTLLQYLLSGK